MARSGLPSPQEIAEKQIARGSAATEAYRKGVQRVTVAPGQRAAQAKEAYLAGIQANVDKWATNTAAVSLQSWVNAALEKGANRLGTGLQAARAKIEAFWAEFAPFLQNAQAQVNAMPSNTYEQRREKALRMMDLLHQFRRRRF